MDTPGPAILGLPSSEKLAVVKMNCAITVRQPSTHPAPVSTTAATTKPATAPEAAKSIRSTDDLIKEFPDQFQGIGWFPGEYKIWLCHDAHPVIHASRKCPITLHPKVKEHLNKMECLGVITCVDEPMDCISSITYVQKANGELCLCLDPCDLNEAIHCDHHKTPTVEEVAHEFAHSCFFTKLDACHRYWSIILDQDSSLLTTFNSPFSRYHFLQLSFGLVCSQDIFQKKMDQILEECQGCIGIADDITIHGHTEAEHDACLWDLMHITCKYDLVFNPQKTHVKAQAINFFGCLYDANGIHPYPGKVNAVHALPAPTNITELQEFLGLVTYLSPFIPGLSTLTTPLWELLKKDADFTWNCTYDTAFEQINEAIISDTTLRYFDPSLPVTIRVDASQVSLGAALLQNGKPIAFASKGLTETECQYANIEREMLAAVFGVERFHTYIYGWTFTIESDHKPLESISRKNLADTPAWLQCMMLCLQGYNFTIHYCPGKEMVIPDTLSWFSPQPGPDLPLDIAIHHAHIMPDCKEAFQQAFVNDPEMRALANLIITGWPEDIKEVPCPLHPYWQHRETLTIEDSLVLQGEALIIPPAKRERTLHQLHQFHQGITKSQLLACGSFFWPGINKAIEEVVHQCEACTQFQSQNAATPLTPTPTPSHPWQMCATDIFMLEGIDHLVVGDFYSKMILVQHLPPGQSNANKVVSLLKEMFSEHGIPEDLCSHDGPQYASAQFPDFCTSWGITHETSSPHYPQSNGFTEACMKSIKQALQWAKYSGADPHLALLALWATPINTKLPSPAELLYQCWLRTTIPAKICNSDPSAIHVHEQINTCSEAAKSQADKCSKTLVPLYAGQPVATYDTLQKIWVPATVIHILPWNSYLGCTSNGSTYHCTWRHLCECSVKAADTVPSGMTATLQALLRPHFIAEQPASPTPAPCMQPTSAAPATLATQMKQAPAVPAMPAVQKNALAPMPVTSHATPVQPQRSGHAHMAPKCLIQEIWELSTWTVHGLCFVMCHHRHPQ